MGEPVFFVCAVQIFQRAISGERHLGRLKFGLWSLMFSEVGKALSKCIPDLVLDCIRRDSPIDQDDASRFVFGQLSISANHALVEFIRLFLHSIANFFSIPKTRLSMARSMSSTKVRSGTQSPTTKAFSFLTSPRWS